MTAGRLANCGCRMGDYDFDIVLEPCAAHDPSRIPAKCAEGCNRRDSETCCGAEWALKCGCSCHGPATGLTSEQIHSWAEQHLIGRELSEEYERERSR